MRNVHRLEIKFIILRIASKKNSIWYEVYFKKYLIAEGSSGSGGWARVKRQRTKSREPLLRTVFFDSGHLQHERERSDVERKYINSDKAKWKNSSLTTLISEVGGGTNIQSKQASVVPCKSYSKTRIKREEPECRSRHCNQLDANFSVD